MIVADTNLIVYLLMEGDRTDEVEAFYLREPDWSAPLLWRSEFTNVLSTYLRAERLDFSVCLELMEAAESIFGDSTFSIPTPRTLDVSKRTGLSGYDSEFIALAEDLGVPIVTYDRKILRACPQLAQTP